MCTRERVGIHMRVFRWFFQCVAHLTHTTTTNNTTTTTTHTTHQKTQHHTRHRQRETEKDRERRQRERREDERGETRQNRRQKKTRQHEREERRQKINFQCGGACPLLVDGVLCLVHPVNHRVFSLLHRFKYDCSLISFSASWLVNSFLISANYFFYAVTSFNYIFLVMQLQFLNFPKII